LIDFHNGYLGTADPDDICFDRGDINCNGIPYESSDIVQLISMFIIIMQNPEIWPIWDECSIVNSDVNADGITLSIADLVYLFKVVAGEAMPYPKPGPVNSKSIDLFTRYTDTGVEVCYNSTVDIGGLLIKIKPEGFAEYPLTGLSIGNMQVKFVTTDNCVGAFIYDDEGGFIPAGEGVLFTIPRIVSPNIETVDASDRFGKVLKVRTTTLPSQFHVSQNRPNPFNMSTEIRLSLPVPSEWRMTVFNVTGQIVREFSGHDNAGEISVVWDGCDESGKPVASGVYLYRATVGDQTRTRAMTLLK
jgi:hypothetical protein